MINIGPASWPGSNICVNLQLSSVCVNDLLFLRTVWHDIVSVLHAPEITTSLATGAVLVFIDIARRVDKENRTVLHVALNPPGSDIAFLANGRPGRTCSGAPWIALFMKNLLSNLDQWLILVALITIQNTTPFFIRRWKRPVMNSVLLRLKS